VKPAREIRDAALIQAWEVYAAALIQAWEVKLK